MSKAALRAEYLGMLRRWARACPAEVRGGSDGVSRTLLRHLAAAGLLPSLLPTLPSASHDSTAECRASQQDNVLFAGGPRCSSLHCGHPHRRRRSVFVCAYLPLYYEADLSLLLERVLRLKEERRSSLDDDLAVFVPVVVEPPRRWPLPSQLALSLQAEADARRHNTDGAGDTSRDGCSGGSGECAGQRAEEDEDTEAPLPLSLVEGLRASDFYASHADMRVYDLTAAEREAKCKHDAAEVRRLLSSLTTPGAALRPVSAAEPHAASKPATIDAASSTSQKKVYAATYVPERLRRAMIFVEVLSSADLERHFTPNTASFGIRELCASELNRLFQPRGGGRGGDQRDARREAEAEGETATHFSSSSSSFPPAAPASEGAIRRVIAGAEWESLFPMHAEPESLVRLRGCAVTAAGEGEAGDKETGSAGAGDRPAHSTRPATSGDASHNGGGGGDNALVVLCPGVCFHTRDGSRLGKGGGFYDSFLGALFSSPSSSASCHQGGQQDEDEEEQQQQRRNTSHALGSECDADSRSAPQKPPARFEVHCVGVVTHPDQLFFPSPQRDDSESGGGDGGGRGTATTTTTNDHRHCRPTEANAHSLDYNSTVSFTPLRTFAVEGAVSAVSHSAPATDTLRGDATDVCVAALAVPGRRPSAATTSTKMEEGEGDEETSTDGYVLRITASAAAGANPFHTTGGEKAPL